jgi:hypothetical protein
MSEFGMYRIGPLFGQVHSPPRDEWCLRHQENFGEANLSAADGMVAHRKVSV